MLIWLPVSVAMAAAMPISGMLGTVTAASMVDVSTIVSATDRGVTASDAMMASRPCYGSTLASDTPASGTCIHCVLCHLSVSLMVPSVPVVPGIAPSRDNSVTPLLSHASFVPDLASPPPRTLANLIAGEVRPSRKRDA